MIETITKVLGWPGVIIAAIAAVYTFTRDRQKGRLDLTKGKLEFADRVQLELAGTNDRLLEVAFLGFTGVTTHGQILRRICATRASINYMPYLTRAAGANLQVTATGIELILSPQKFEDLFVIRTGTAIISICIPLGAILVFRSGLASNDIVATVSALLAYLFFLWLFSKMLKDADQMSDAAALAGYVSATPWIRSLMEKRRLPIY